MKYYLILVGLISFAVFGQNDSQKNELLDYTTHVDGKLAIQYPKNWILEVPGQYGEVFCIYSPPASAADGYQDFLSLVAEDLQQPNDNLDSFVKNSENEYKTMSENVKFLEGNKLKKGTSEYYKSFYTDGVEEASSKFERYYFVANKKGYTLTFGCKVADFEKSKAVAESILNSFIINK
jgi:hypothetical protein